MPDFRLSLLVAALVLAGCNREPAAIAEPVAEPVAAAAPAAPANACPPQPAREPVAADAPKPEFPTLVVETFDDGCFDLAQQRGKWVVVNFWATWCNPCLKEIPDLAEFDAKRDDVQVVGLAFEEIERADMEAFLVEHPIAYPFAIVDTMAPPADFTIPPALPMTVLIDPQGKVVQTKYGPVTSAELATLIDGHAAAASEAADTAAAEKPAT
jgi:thiol-disulfide isomerase/thioredoxin